MASFSLEYDDRTKEQREADKAMRKQHQANKNSTQPLDTNLSEDIGHVRLKIRINPDFDKWVKGLCLFCTYTSNVQCHHFNTQGNKECIFDWQESQKETSVLPADMKIFQEPNIWSLLCPDSLLPKVLTTFILHPFFYSYWNAVLLGQLADCLIAWQIDCYEVLINHNIGHNFFRIWEEYGLF